MPSPGWAERKGALLAYAQMQLREEIQAEALVRNLPGFARFLPVAALFHAQVLWAPAEAARTEVDFLLRRERDWP